jgi:cytochrome P450
VRRFQTLIGQVDEAVYELIEERRATASEGDDVLSMLLQARHDDGSPMSPAELRDELMTSLVAGHETTASQLAWAFECLARMPQVAKRLDDEDYLTATIYEIQRLKPVLPNAEPRLVKRPITIGGYRYPAGVSLIASAFLVHRDPNLYPDPHAFRPERFLGVKPGTYTWIPFGGGRRRCLGASFAVQEMKIVLRTVFARSRMAPATAQPEPTGRRSITFSPAQGARVVLTDRVPALRSEPAAAAVV